MQSAKRVKATIHFGNDRLFWADLCRVVAIYGVVLIHACGPSFYQFGKLPVSSWLQSVILDSLVRCSVPLFVMLSGALILAGGHQPNQSDDELRQLPRRLLRVLLPLVVWSGIYLMFVARSGAYVNPASILVQPAMYHLWFVYMIVGIYLLLPILRPVFAAIQQSSALSVYFLLAWLLITSIPIYWPIPLLSLLQQNSLFGYGGYFILGAVIVSRPRIPFSSVGWLGVFALGVAVTVWVTWYQSDRAGAPVETAFLYFSSNVVVSSVAAFVLFSRIRIPERWAGLVRYLSDRTFFVYFVHVLALEYVRFHSIIMRGTEQWPLGLTILVISFLAFALSLFIASVVGRIPGNRYVFG